jgi:predicted restriction endonuclease
MTTIETYLDNLTTNKIPNNIFSSYKYFGYEYGEIFKIDLILLLDLVYPDISVINDKKIRLEQTEFKNNLLKLYDNKCVISNNDNEDELEACHIIPVSEDGDYSNDNGLILTRNLHATFDKFKWSINPDTIKIELNPNIKSGSIKDYINNNINIKMNPFLYLNLKWHYDKFIEHLNK